MTTEQAINEIVSSGYGQAQCHEETMRMAVDALRSQQWISVNDRLPYPKDNNNIVVLALKQGIVAKLHCVARFNGSCWIENGKEVTVTHWMPLPEPPKEAHDE